MRDVTSIKLPIMVSNSHFWCKLDIVKLKSSLQVRIIESISVITGNNIGIILLNKFCKFQQSVFLRRLVEDSYVTWELRFRLVIELLYIISTKTSIYYQKSLTLIHQWNHHYFIFLRIWKFQRIFSCLYIIRENF